MATVVKRKRTYNAALRQEQAQMTRARILDAARRLLTAGTYSSVTMEEIAKEAGVSSQTVYAVFGNKLQLAQGIIEIGFHFEGLEELDARLLVGSDPEVLLRGSAQISRRIYEICAEPASLPAGVGRPQAPRPLQRKPGPAPHPGDLSTETHSRRAVRLRADLSPGEVLAIIWTMTASDLYSMLVFERGWAPAR